MTLHDRFVLLVQTECLGQLFTGEMALHEVRAVMRDVFGVLECDIESALEEKRLGALAYDYISWKVCDENKPVWINK